MAAAGAPAARCLTVLYLLVVILGQPGQALGLKGAAAAAVNPPSYEAYVDPPSFEELTTSLVVNQLAILQLIQDVSNASGAAETCTQSEARREEEAAARDATLKEALVAGQQRCSQETLEALRATQETLTETCTQSEARREEEAAARDARLKEALEAGQQRCSQETLEALRATQETLTASGRAEVTAVREEVTAVREEVTALREEVRQQMDKFLEELHKLTAPTAQTCPLGWVRRESSCYLFDETAKRTWAASRTYCRSLGGDLVKITSAEENQFIIGQLGDSIWIGLNDRATEGRFVWSDSSLPTYTAWGHGQPDNAGGVEHCAEIRKAFNYVWNDWQCHIKIGTVCEKAVGA